MINMSNFWMCLKAAVLYIPNNFIMCISVLVITVILGSLIAMARAYRVPVLSQILSVLMAFLKALPANLVLIICLIIYTTNFSKIMAFFHLKVSIKQVNLIYLAIFALSICTISSISEVIRGGLISVDKGQYEAGYSVGLTKWQTFRTIIMPQATRNLVAPLTNSVLALMKSTSLVSIIGVMDIINGSVNSANASYCYMEAYLAAALVFWVIGFVLERLSVLAEKHFSKSVKRLA